MKNQFNALLLTAALAGLAGGTTVAAQSASNGTANSAKVIKAGLRYSGAAADTTKHSCKGKNDCKGQGGCKSSDNGCKGKNSCKGKCGCATDGSKMPGLFV
jgi:curli biogenesis system outer membrane secretion channel CsgG